MAKYFISYNSYVCRVIDTLDYTRESVSYEEVMRFAKSNPEKFININSDSLVHNLMDKVDFQKGYLHLINNKLLEVVWEDHKYIFYISKDNGVGISYYTLNENGVRLKILVTESSFKLKDFTITEQGLLRISILVTPICWLVFEFGDTMYVEFVSHELIDIDEDTVFVNRLLDGYKLGVISDRSIISEIEDIVNKGKIDDIFCERIKVLHDNLPNIVTTEYIAKVTKLLFLKG